MRNAIIFTSVCFVALCSIASCQPKKQKPNAVTFESGSVTVDSIAPDSSLVIVEDTTVTIGIVPDNKAPHKKK